MAVSTLLSAKWRDRSLDGYLRGHVPTQETSCVSIVRETNNVTRTLLIVLVQPVLFLH